MKTLAEVTNKMIEIGGDFSDYIQNVEKNLKPIGSIAKHPKVSGQTIESYEVEKNTSGIGPAFNITYITSAGKIGMTRENNA